MSRNAKAVKRSEKTGACCRHKIAFSISQPVSNTFLQTQTYTPITECKYLDVGMVGCYLIPPFKDVLFRRRSNKHKAKCFCMICCDILQSHFDFIALNNLCPAVGDIHYLGATLIHSPLAINAHQISATHSQEPLDRNRETHYFYLCCILLLMFLLFENRFQIT